MISQMIGARMSQISVHQLVNMCVCQNSHLLHYYVHKLPQVTFIMYVLMQEMTIVLPGNNDFILHLMLLKVRSLGVCLSFGIVCICAMTKYEVY